MEAILRLLKGESIDSVSRELVVTVEALSRWREEFLAAGLAGLKGRTPEEAKVAALEKKIGQRAMELELHKKKRSGSAREATVRPSEADREERVQRRAESAAPGAQG